MFFKKKDCDIIAKQKDLVLEKKKKNKTISIN